MTAHASLESCVFLVLGLKSDLESWCGRAGSVVFVAHSCVAVICGVKNCGSRADLVEFVCGALLRHCDPRRGRTDTLPPTGADAQTHTHT